ncbi:MAG TPA: tetratricopeptide repeat protein [Candidatus Eisenbacteria bacterium]|nr:tetratricopeptide repeat protein [Candidatus Eisenbacteria bacterium]
MKQARTGTQKSAGRLALLVLIVALPLLATPAHGQAAPSPFDRARELIAEEKRIEAIPLLEAELRERPDNEEARMLLARVLSWERQYDRSLAEYRILLEKRGDPRTRAAYARVLAWSGRHDDAIREYRTAIAADSSNLETRVGYARALSWSGDLAGASAEYERILERDPSMGEAWLGLASVSRWRGAATASERLVAMAEERGADRSGIEEERNAVRRALEPSAGGGFTASDERQYVPGGDYTLETQGPYAQARSTAGSVNLLGRISWIGLTETSAAGGAPTYDLESEVYRGEASFLREYPWQVSLAGEYRTFEQRDQTATFPLGEDDDFIGWGARLWRFSGRFAPFASIRREYVPIKDLSTTTFDPGHVDQFETGLSWQWSGRGTADAAVSRGLYSDDNSRWSAGAGVAYRVKTRVPTITVDGKALFRDWEEVSQSYFTPLESFRGSTGIAFAGWSERAALDYGFRYEFAGLTSSTFADIWTHAWSGYSNITAFDTVPLGLEASYTVDNNSYETWYLGLSASARW